MNSTVRFWGVRGSVPAPGPATAVYGGNTPCVTVRGDGDLPLVIDAGTGIRSLGLALAEEAAAGGTLHILLSHFHWDHVQGLPFFPPLYQPGWKLVFHAPGPQAETEQILSRLFAAPYFPAGDSVRAELEFVEIRSSVDIGQFTIRSAPLCHPGGSTAFRIEANDGSVTYASDHEFGDDSYDSKLAALADGSSLLVADAQYTPEELPQRSGWGHGCWMDANRLARQASVGQLALFHHDPQRDDQALRLIESQAQSDWDHAFAAREGASLRL